MLLLNRRRMPRFPFHSRGSIRIAEQQHDGIVIDISIKGVLFASGCGVGETLGQVCRLSIVVGEQPGCLIADGVVVNQREHLLGIEFHELTEAARQGLEQIVEMNLGTRAILDRDVPVLCRSMGG